MFYDHFTGEEFDLPHYTAEQQEAERERCAERNAILYESGCRDPDLIYTVELPPRSDIAFIIDHLCTALNCYAEAARWNYDRACLRGLKNSLATLALDAAATLAEDLASDLEDCNRPFLAPTDLRWLDAAVVEVVQSRGSAIRAGEGDLHAIPIDPTTTEPTSPQLDQLREIEGAGIMSTAKSAVESVAYLLGLALAGTSDPLRCRAEAAECIATMQGKLRECSDWAT